MNTKKYHIVHTESSASWGGQEIRTLNEVKLFSEQGHKVTLITAINSPIASRAKDYNINLIELPIHKKSLKCLLAMRQWIANNEFDIINTHSSWDSWMVAISMCLKTKKRPLIRTRHVSTKVSNNIATRWLYHVASNHIVTTGKEVKKSLIEYNGIPSHKITSIPSYVDCQQFTPSKDKIASKKIVNLPTEKTIITIVAILRSWKGHQHLIEAVSQLKHQNIHLAIVGDGPQMNAVQQQIENLKLEDKVTICGNQKNVTPWLQATDIFVHPSYGQEGVPQSVMQAMACHLPIIATPVGSTTELINSNTGILIDPENPSLIKEKIEELLASPEKSKRLAENAYNHIKKNYDIKFMYTEMHQVHSNLLNSIKHE